MQCPSFSLPSGEGWGRASIMKKLKNILLWVVLGGYLITILGFVAEMRDRIVCKGIEVNVVNDEMNRFIKKEDIKKVLDKYKLKMIGIPIDSVNTFMAEQLISKNPAVYNVAAYTTIDGLFKVKVEQRQPILRVINKNLQQYYIDDKAQVIPMRTNYTSYTLVANGNIDEPFDVSASRNIFPLKKDTILVPNILYDLYYVAIYIHRDDFWRSQIEQLYVDSHLDIRLIPRVGSQIIIFGKGIDIDEKFKKLKAMYRTFNQIGWNQYKTINLKYKEQVVCTKR